jgi:hypothetical protein
VFAAAPGADTGVRAGQSVDVVGTCCLDATFCCLHSCWLAGARGGQGGVLRGGRRPAARLPARGVRGRGRHRRGAAHHRAPGRRAGPHVRSRAGAPRKPACPARPETRPVQGAPETGLPSEPLAVLVQHALRATVAAQGSGLSDGSSGVLSRATQPSMPARLRGRLRGGRHGRRRKAYGRLCRRTSCPASQAREGRSPAPQPLGPPAAAWARRTRPA